MQDLAAPDMQMSPQSTGGALRPCLQVRRDWPWLAMPERLVVQVATDKALALVPNTPPWFLGVLNLRGVLIPAFDLGLWAGEASAPATSEYALLSPGPRGIALRCIGLPQLAQLHPVTASRSGDAPERLQPFLQQSWQSPTLGDTYSFDPWRWLDQSRDSLTSTVPV